MQAFPLIASIALALLSCAASAATPAGKPASPATIAAQARVLASMPVDDGQDAAFIKQGFIATPKETKVYNKNGKLVWDMELLDWMQGTAPATVNPSLWRQMKLLKEHGLYQIADGVWQVRGFDMSNMEVVRGQTGWIVVDPLMTIETAAAAMKFVNAQLGERPVSAVIYGHSHADHFGGARSVITPGTTPPIYAPEHFLEETVAEQILAGTVMSRRASYQVGTGLDSNSHGYVGSGILGAGPTNATVSLVPPTDLIRTTGETRVIDGVKFVFQIVPETEAPSEMNFFLPEKRTLYVSEDTTCTMHNLQTPRGALVRDGLKWAGYITEQIGMWGDQAESLVTGHCWARFGNAAIRNYLELQRDNYKFIHDQTVRRFNLGDTPTEAAENVKRPAALTNQWSNRDYYGTKKQNVKGVYQRYIGWWDGIPAHLDMLPTGELSRNYVDAIGGSKAVLRVARRAMDKGEYRWATQVLNDLVFADPNNREAKSLLADSYEQLGYQTESGIWRNYYLVGAAELRGKQPEHMVLDSPDSVAAMPTAAFLALVAARLNPDKIGDRRMTAALDATDRDDKSLLTLRNAVIIPEVGKSIDAPTVSVSGTRILLMGLFIRKIPLDQLEKAGLKVDGDRTALLALLDAIEPPPPDFPLVTP